jgi:hypothetical protein
VLASVKTETMEEQPLPLAASCREPAGAARGLREATKVPPRKLCLPRRANILPGDEEFLFYPLDTGEDPVCLRCASKMLLAGSEVREGQPTLLVFRCVRCGRSEKFLCED